MTTLTISIPDSSKAFLDEQATKAGMSTAEDYVRKMVLDAERRAARRELDAKLLEGLNSGPAVDLTPDEWESMRREALAQVEAETRRA